MANGLLTPQLREELRKYPLYSQDKLGKKARVICKFFLPGTAWAWYVIEAGAEPVRPLREDGTAGPETLELYGLTVNQYGHEMGYFFLSELEELRVNMPIEDQDGRQLCKIPVTVELDKAFKARTLGDLLKELSQ